MTSRGPWTGMLTIFRFNYPLYIAAAAVLAGAVAGFLLTDMAAVKIACALAAVTALYFLAGSLGVSHLVYDRSDLYRWQWLKRALGPVTARQAVVCHSGYDEVSGPLRRVLQPERLAVLDHFDAARMTEPSIHRARRLFPPPAGTVSAPFHAWPLEDGGADVIFGLLAVHEFRRAEERAQWCQEARRCLRTGGRVIVAEHLRDFPNFLAFGPGFLHFHSAAAWRRSFAAAGLRAADEFSITPWIRVFVLTRHD